jgi:hypothetical protein
MAEMEQMVATPRNSIPMRGGAGPYGPIDMGGMFTLVKIRDDMDYARDPGWYTAGPRAHRVGSTSAPASPHEGHGR